jgi:predicted CXXCH cytochrome family protein
MTFFVRGFRTWCIGIIAVLVLSKCGSPASQYVGSATCSSCHASEYAAWESSDHMRAMQLPTSETVLGDFDEAEFDHFGDQYAFTKRDSTFVVVYNGDSLSVSYTFGHFPLQQYLLPTHGSRMQALTVAWDVIGKKWYSLYPDEPTPEGDALNWKSAHLNWNYMCSDCHSTGLKRGYDLATDSYETSWEELTVGCEACHGPGRDHSDWAETQNGADPFVTAVKEDVVPGVGRPTTRALEVEVNMCARCHSRRVGLAESFDHEAEYLDQYAPSLLEDSLYFGDGQIREEVYVYASFLQSKMAQKGVTCSDCHDAHSGQLKRIGNALCVDCHASEVFDTSIHTGHIPDTEAAQCVTCHMPARTYMGVDPRRDHRFGIPDPVLSKDLGSPDVCASCHPNRSASWANQTISVLRSSNPAVNIEHQNTVARAAKALSLGEQNALELAQAALTDSSASRLSKGSLLSRLGRSVDPEAVRLVMIGLQSDSEFEIVGALRALREWVGMLPGPDLSAFLQHGTRWVRMEAVATALTFGTTDWSATSSSGALKEYVDSQHAVSERPEAHVNLGRMNESLNQFELADREFTWAVQIDSNSADLWMEMALFRGRAAQTFQNTDPAAYINWRRKAEESFRKAAFLPSPIRSDVLYLFGLFLAEDPTRMPDAAIVLKEAVRLDPVHARKAYNAGLAFQQMKEASEAEILLKSAAVLGMSEARDALVILYMQTGRWLDANSLNEELLVEFPNRTELMERAAYISSQL